MTAAFFDYPKAAAFGRVVPKNRIYEHAGASTALRDLFVTQVDQIVWKYKLAPETINLAATKAVSGDPGVRHQPAHRQARRRRVARHRPRDSVPADFRTQLVREAEGGGRLQAAERGGFHQMGCQRLFRDRLGARRCAAPAAAGRRSISAALRRSHHGTDARGPASGSATRTSRRAWRGWRRSAPRRGRWNASRPDWPARSNSTSAWRSMPS